VEGAEGWSTPASIPGKNYFDSEPPKNLIWSVGATRPGPTGIWCQFWCQLDFQTGGWRCLFLLAMKLAPGAWTEGFFAALRFCASSCQRAKYRFRFYCSQGRGGSSPLSGTNFLHCWVFPITLIAAWSLTRRSLLLAAGVVTFTHRRILSRSRFITPSDLSLGSSRACNSFLVTEWPQVPFPTFRACDNLVGGKGDLGHGLCTEVGGCFG